MAMKGKERMAMLTLCAKLKGVLKLTDAPIFDFESNTLSNVMWLDLPLPFAGLTGF